MSDIPPLQRAAVTFASGYAKRLMERQYDRVMQTKAVRELRTLTRAHKYAIEVALNGLAACLATKEESFEKNPVTALMWEIGRDASSELSKRLLNGGSESANVGSSALQTEAESPNQQEERNALDSLLQMNATDLKTFLTWLRDTTPEERGRMAENMAQLADEQQAKLAALSPEQAKLLLESSSVTPAKQVETKDAGPLSALTGALRSLNDRLERRAQK